MKIITKQKCRTVQTKNAAEFDEEFNRVSEELPAGAELVWDGAMCVHFIYKEVQQIPESAKEEFEQRGIKYFCKDCPHFCKSKDGRKRSSGCDLDVTNAVDYTPACEILYQGLAAGKRGGSNETD